MQYESIFLLKRSLSITKAITLSIGELNQPVITKYQLGVIFFNLSLSGKYEGQSINLPKNGINVTIFDNKIDELLESGVLQQFQDFDKVFSIIGKNIYTEEEAACSIDPFSFISHLSAMDFHGLTDRMPKIIVLSSPAQKDWRKFANDKMNKDLKENLGLYKEKNLPLLTRIQIDKIRKKSVQYYSSIHLGAYKSIKGKNLRVSTIGRTFLDMLKRPDLCGGIYHVIDVFKEHSAPYLNLIIDELEQHGKPIDKVRAGYILQGLCGLEHKNINEWQKKYVARGGSRKLDPTEEYSPNYSEKWCLSINIEID